MDREQFKALARAELIKQAPGVAVELLDSLVSSSVVQQRWFDRVAQKRPRGFIAWVRRLRGQERGLTDDQRRELEKLVADAVKKYQ